MPFGRTTFGGGRLLRAEYLTARFPEDAGPFVFTPPGHGRDSDVRFPEGNPGFYGAVCEGEKPLALDTGETCADRAEAKKDFTMRD